MIESVFAATIIISMQMDTDNQVYAFLLSAQYKNMYGNINILLYFHPLIKYISQVILLCNDVVWQ